MTWKRVAVEVEVAVEVTADLESEAGRLAEEPEGLIGRLGSANAVVASLASNRNFLGRMRGWQDGKTAEVQAASVMSAEVSKADAVNAVKSDAALNNQEARTL